MRLLSKPITEIDESDLQELCDESYSEARSIEYKRQLNFTSNEEREKFFSQLCSFSNSAGGHLIYGIGTNAANRGVPESVIGQKIEDPDSWILQIEQATRHAIRPRIPFFESKAVSLAKGGHSLVFRIPQSWNRPHQVVFNHNYLFYGNARATGNIRLRLMQLRNLFVASAELERKLEAFRATRIMTSRQATLHAVLCRRLDAPAFRVNT